MSRTDKDRPYWVKMNDRSLGTVEEHDHIDRGYRNYYRTIVPGERTLVPYGEPRWFLRHTDGTPGMTIEEDIEARSSSYYYGRFFDPMLTRGGRLRWYYEHPQRYEYVGRVQVPVLISSGVCDIDVIPRSQREVWRKNCSVEPLRHLQPRYRDTPDKHSINRSYRRSEGPAMLKMVKEYNAEGEVDDSQWQDFNPHHDGYWW